MLGSGAANIPQGPRYYEAWSRTQVHARRVERARAHLREAAALGPMIVMTSWGKDSLAMLDLAIDTLGPGVQALHLASPYGLPGYEETIAHFEARCTVHVDEARLSLAEYIDWHKRIGLAHERTREEQKKLVNKIKRDRGSEWCEAHGYDVQALGMRAAEGGPRAKVLRARGATYQIADGSWRSCPIAWWESRDVWAWILSRELPYNRRLYDAETHGMTRESIRNTGWLSTDGAGEGRIAWLWRHFPEQARALEQEFPRLALMR